MNKKAFTLIEIMLGILIASIVIIIGFQALNSVIVGKVKLIESTNIEKEAFKFSQRFFEEIKKGGTIDYEEYFNRMAINSGSTDLYLSGHYKKESSFGNSGSVNNGFYYCRSGNGKNKNMGSGTINPERGCLNAQFNDINNNEHGKKQRYGQYFLQFIDYNSNYDEDKYDSDGDGIVDTVLLGDEDGNENIRGDDDDENLGIGPKLFKMGSGVTELYLISADKKRRTFFRWTINIDPKKPNTANCTTTDNGKTYTGSGCLGTIEFLKLDGKDWGFNHNKSGSGYSDGVIDTWLINKDFVENIGDSGDKFSGDKYWMKLFPDSINVKNFEIQVFPNADMKNSWKLANIDISPYIKIKMTLTPSRKTKKKIKGKIPEFNISTTINLTQIYSW